MARFRIFAALAVATVAAACADTPTAPAAAPAGSPLASLGSCSPTLAGPTAVVTDGSTYSYKAIYNSNDCPSVSSVVWTVTGGSVYIYAGIKAFILPAEGANCMNVHQRINWVGGGYTYLHKVARVDGYTGACLDVAVE